MLRVWCSCLIALLASVAFAEVLELDGTVKAVDADARTLSIERKTPKGMKTLELEVNKKAGDLSSVKVGDRLTFSYDPDLEIVTKINGAGSDAGHKEKTKWCRFRLAISEVGEASIAITPLESPESGQANQKESLGGGKWRLTRYFSKASDIGFFQSLLGTPVNAEVDPARQYVVLEPKKQEGFDEPLSRLVYPIRVGVPLELVVDVATTSKSHWPAFHVFADPLTDDMQRPVFSLRTRSEFRDDATFSAWSSKRNSVKQRTFVVEETGFNPSEPWGKTFRLPVPNVKSEDFYTLAMVCASLTGEKTYIHRIRVEGRLVPLLGMGVDQNGDVVFVKSILPKGVASEAGVREGDAILAIAGKKPTTANDAVARIAKTHFGEACEVVVKRGEKELTFTMKPELEE